MKKLYILLLIACIITLSGCSFSEDEYEKHQENLDSYDTYVRTVSFSELGVEINWYNDVLNQSSCFKPVSPDEFDADDFASFPCFSHLVTYEDMKYSYNGGIITRDYSTLLEEMIFNMFTEDDLTKTDDEILYYKDIAANMLDINMLEILSVMGIGYHPQKGNIFEDSSAIIPISAVFDKDLGIFTEFSINFTGLPDAIFNELTVTITYGYFDLEYELLQNLDDVIVDNHPDDTANTWILFDLVKNGSTTDTLYGSLDKDNMFVTIDELDLYTFSINLNNEDKVNLKISSVYLDDLFIPIEIELNSTNNYAYEIELDPGKYYIELSYESGDIPLEYTLYLK